MQVLRGPGGRVRGGQVGRGGHGAGLQRHHHAGAEREPSGRRGRRQPQDDRGDGRRASGRAEPDHVVRAAVLAVRGRAPDGRRRRRRLQVHHHRVRVRGGPAGGAPAAQLHRAVDHGDRAAGRAVVPGVRQHRHQVPQGRRGDDGVHVGGRPVVGGDGGGGRGRGPRRLVVRAAAGRQGLRVPAVRRPHGRRVPVRAAGVPGRVPRVQETDGPAPRRRRPRRADAPVLPAGAAARQRRAAAQVRQAAGHHGAVVGRRRRAGP